MKKETWVNKLNKLFTENGHGYLNAQDHIEYYDEEYKPKAAFYEIMEYAIEADDLRDIRGNS